MEFYLGQIVLNLLAPAKVLDSTSQTEDDLEE
jgi:hypothetical protein